MPEDTDLQRTRDGMELFQGNFSLEWHLVRRLKVILFCPVSFLRFFPSFLSFFLPFFLSLVRWFVFSCRSFALDGSSLNTTKIRKGELLLPLGDKFLFPLPLSSDGTILLHLNRSTDICENVSCNNTPGLALTRLTIIGVGSILWDGEHLFSECKTL